MEGFVNKTVINQKTDATQTDAIKTVPNGTSMTHAEEITQTEEVVSTSFKTDMKLNAKCIAFLAKVLPTIEQMILTNKMSHCFTGYNPLWEDETLDFHLETSFPPPTHERKSKGKKAEDYQYVTPPMYHCSCLAFNSTGRILVASYGQQDHIGWCLHKGLVMLWSVFTESKKGKDKTSQTVTISSHPSLFAQAETDTCLLSVSCHPDIPTIVCGGTFGGEIVVWNFANHEEGNILTYVSKMSELSHKEPVISISWIKIGSYGMMSSLGMSANATYLIASLSSDGTLLLWSLENFLSEPVARYNIQPLRGKDAPVLGANAFAPSHFDVSQFFVGTENGGVYKGNFSKNPKWTTVSAGLSSLGKDKDKDKAKDAKETAAEAAAAAAAAKRKALAFNPVVFEYQQHAGPAQCLAVCRRKDLLFATAGSDGRIFVRNSLTRTPVLALDTPASVLALCWSEHSPTTMAYGTNEGEVNILSLVSGVIVPIRTFQPSVDYSMWELEHAETRIQPTRPDAVLAAAAAAESKKAVAAVAAAAAAAVEEKPGKGKKGKKGAAAAAAAAAEPEPAAAAGGKKKPRETTAMPIFTMCFSHNAPYFACADASGRVYLYFLPTYMFLEGEGDLKVLDGIIKESD